MSEELLRVEHLSKGFSSGSSWALRRGPMLQAVDDVSFTVRRGETFGIVGESGCGKTTLGKCIVRLYRPEGGRMLYRAPQGEEKDLLALKGRESFAMRRAIQMVFQDPYASLNPMRNILDAFDEPLRIHGFGNRAQRRDIVAHALEKVNLQPDYMYRYPHEFSGGQRQRIGVARALALDPKLVVCDEPVSALDVSIQAQILNLMRELQRKYQLTYIFISHNLSVVKHICDRIAVMYLGNIVEIAPKKELFDNPLHPYTKALLGAIPIPDPDIPAMQDMLEGDVPSPINPPKGCCFHTRCHGCCEECTAQKPKLVNVGNDHWVACCKI